MWLRRTSGGLLEVVEGVETKRGEPFEVPDEVGERLLANEEERYTHDRKMETPHEKRFETAPKTVAKKAAAAEKHVEPHATGPGGIPIEDVQTSDEPAPTKPRARRSD